MSSVNSKVGQWRRLGVVVVDTEQYWQIYNVAFIKCNNMNNDEEYKQLQTVHLRFFVAI